MVVGGTYIVLEVDAILQVIWKIALGLKLVDAVEPVVSPAFTHFKFALVDAEHHLRWSQVVYQLNTVLIHLRLDWLSTLRSLVHLQEDWDVCPLSILTISIWVNFKPPSDPIGQKGGRIDWFLWVTQFGEMSQSELTTSIFRNDITWEVRLNLTWAKSIDWTLVEVTNLFYYVGTLFY